MAAMTSIDLPAEVASWTLDTDDSAWLERLAPLDRGACNDDRERAARRRVLVDPLAKRVRAHSWWWVLSATKATEPWPVSLVFQTSGWEAIYQAVAYARYVYGHQKQARDRTRDHVFSDSPDYAVMSALCLKGGWWLRTIEGLIRSEKGWTERDIGRIRAFHAETGIADRLYTTKCVGTHGEYVVYTGIGMSRLDRNGPFTPRECRLVAAAFEQSATLQTPPTRYRDPATVGDLSLRLRWLWPLMATGRSAQQVWQGLREWTLRVRATGGDSSAALGPSVDSIKRYEREIEERLNGP